MRSPRGKVLELREDASLDLEILRRRFDDEVGVLKAAVVLGERHVGLHRRPLLGGEGAVLDSAIDLLRELRPSGVERFRRNVDHHHRDPRGREHLRHVKGDVGTDLAGPHDANSLERPGSQNRKAKSTSFLVACFAFRSARLTSRRARGGGGPPGPVELRMTVEDLKNPSHVLGNIVIVKADPKPVPLSQKR